MVEVVDAIVAELVLKGLDQYEAGFNRATAAHGRFYKSVGALKSQTFDLQAEGQKYKAGADAMASGEEQAAQRITRARKARSDSAKAAADVESASAKKAADAVKAAAQAKVEAEKAAAREIEAARRAEQAFQKRQSANAIKTHYASGPAVFEAKAAEIRANEALIASYEKLRAVEAQVDAQARASSFLTGRDNLSGRSARGSADVFREQFKREEQAARDAAAAEAAASKRGSVTLAPDLFSESAARQRGSGTIIGSRSEPGARSEAARQTEIARQVRVEAEQTVVAETEINSAMVEQTRLQAGLLAARGEDRTLLREQISDMRTYNQLLRAGLSEEAAAIELDTIRVSRAKALAEQQAAGARSQTGKDLLRFGEGAGIGRAFGSTATVAGIAAAGVAAAGVAAISTGIDYAKQIKDTADAVGLTTRQVQVYQAAAREAGVSTDQFRSGIGQLNSYLGKAKEGDEQAAKTFAALGISIKDAGSAGDVLPTLIDRLSSIKDPAQRAAVETRLFGEEGRRLDSVLSSGNDKINELAAALEATGAVLSSDDIAKLDDTSKKLAEVKAELSVDIAKVVADNADAIRDLASAFAFLADHAGAAFQNYSRFRKAGFDVATSLGAAAVGAITGDPVGGRAPAKASDAFPTTVQSGRAGNISGLFAPKGPRGKSADQLATEAEQRTKRFKDELARYQDQQLSAQADMTGDIQERAAIENQLSLREAARAKADIDSQAKINISHGANPELERARARILKAEVDRANGLESDVREQQVSIDQAKIENDHTLTHLSIEQQLLDGTQEFARTAKDRLAIQLRLLDLEKQQERASLEGQLSQLKPGDKRRLDIQAQIDALPAKYGERAQVAAHQNLGPWAYYVDKLPRTAAEVNEQFQQAAVNGVEALNSSLGKTIAQTLHLHGLLGQILGDFIQIAIKSEEAKLFGGSGGGSGGLGGLFSGIGAIFGGGAQGNPAGVLSAASFDALPGLAGGGSIGILGNGGVDRNLLSINGQPVARVNQGENINIVPANMKAASAASAAVGLPVVQHFDLRGAVMTQDILNHINAKSDEAAARGAAGGARLSADQQARRARRSLR